MKIAFYIFSIVFSTSLLSQTYVGQWRDHLPHTKCNEVTQSNSQVFFATESVLFSVDKEDKSMERLSKIHGLSNVGISTIRFSIENDVLVVGFADGGLNLVKGNSIVNMPDILNSSILGNKRINDIFFENNFAWLSCGFGIVVIDLEREEVKDSFLIGEGGDPLNISSLTILNETVFATSGMGLHFAEVNGPNLADFTNWSLDASLPIASEGYDNLTHFNGNLWLSSRETPGTNEKVYQREDSNWMSFLEETRINRIQSSQDFLTITKVSSPVSYNQDLSFNTDMFQLQTGEPIDAKSAITDDNGHLWVADAIHGGIWAFDTWNNQALAPNGPLTSSVWAIDSHSGETWVAPGVLGGSWGNDYNNDSFFFYKNGVWGNFKDDPQLSQARDHLSVAIDPLNKDHVYFGSWNQGLVEVLNGEIIAIHNALNGVEQIQESNINEGIYRIWGMDFDTEGNLWMSNSHADEGIVVRNSSGNFIGLNYQPTLPNTSVTEPLGDLVHTASGQVWVIIGRSHGLFVTDYGGSISNQSDDQFKRINTTGGNGGLHTNDVRAIAEDLDGEIWIGTSEGITVFYNPTNIFSNSPSDAQRVLVRQDGNLQYLLDSEVISCITIDGGNRKWIGTENSGVFLMSEDGTEEIHHFTTANSPLISNTVRDIGIDHINGEVFIGTSKGMVSFTADATNTRPENECLKVFPNPVKSDFRGDVAIDGLYYNSIVKITDIAGNLVKETISNGGRAVWDKTNFSGEKVKTGVYLAMAVDEAGESSCVTKILVIN